MRGLAHTDADAAAVPAQAAEAVAHRPDHIPRELQQPATKRRAGEEGIEDPERAIPIDDIDRHRDLQAVAAAWCRGQRASRCVPRSDVGAAGESGCRSFCPLPQPTSRAASVKTLDGQPPVCVYRYLWKYVSLYE